MSGTTNPILFLLSVGLSLVTALAVDRLTERRGLTPPGLRIAWRRAAATTLLAGVFWIGVFSSLLTFGTEPPDPSGFAIPQLFLMHAILVMVLGLWLLLGFAVGRSPSADAVAEGSSPGGVLRRVAGQLGLVARRVHEELALGVLAGVVGWLVTLTVMAVVAAALGALVGSESLPQEVPEVIVWTAGLPVIVRIAISLSAGVVEEIFFRGFLQPRIGIGASAVLFVLAHAGYGAPLMLVALTFLSFFLAYLVRWRQSLWAAITAHAFFDLIQLLVVIPWALEVTGFD